MEFDVELSMSSALMNACPETDLWEEALVGSSVVENVTLPFNATSASELDLGLENFAAYDGNTREAMRSLKYYAYGIALPAVCSFGIVGNILNLFVLTRPSMKGPAYVYMRGYAVAALLAIIFAIPFSGRILLHNEIGPWTNYLQAFFHVHLELFLGNACLGIGVLMLVALTIERYIAVCRLGQNRTFPANQTPLIAVSLSLLAILLYVPYVFRAYILTCVDNYGETTYQKRENLFVVQSTWWAVYLWILEVIFKLGPILIIVHLNCCIIIAYRRTCANRRRMTKKPVTLHSHSHSTTTTTNSSSTTNVHLTGSVCNVNSVNATGAVTSTEDCRRFREERRLMFLLGSTSILFFLCTTPQLVLSLMIHEAVLRSYSFQIFRAVANILEVANYSITFYIYCLFSRDFRSTFLRTLPSSWQQQAQPAQNQL